MSTFRYNLLLTKTNGVRSGLLQFQRTTGTPLVDDTSPGSFICVQVPTSLNTVLDETEILGQLVATTLGEGTFTDYQLGVLTKLVGGIETITLVMKFFIDGTWQLGTVQDLAAFAAANPSLATQIGTVQADMDAAVDAANTAAGWIK